MAQTHYKLNYFDGRGAGECARQLFALAGVKYEDARFNDEQWPKVKPNMPFGQMPMLEVDGKQLPQSFALNRYLARTFGFAGKCNFEQAQVDAAADQFRDYKTEIIPYLEVLAGEEEGDLEKLKETLFKPAVEKHYAFFTKLIKASGSGFLVGDKVSWADLLLSEHVAMIVKKNTPEILAKFPEVAAHAEKVRSIPALKKWIETRPDSSF